MLLSQNNIKSGLISRLFILLSIGLAGNAYSGIDSIEEAVNRAGKQRMVTQRMLKDYAMVGMNLEYGNPGDDLKKMIALFDQTLADLKALSVNDAVNQSLNKVEELWQPVKSTLETTPDRNKAASLQSDLENLLRLCHENTGLISKASGSSAGEIVNISGRQRMLSQRLASLYMLRVWGIDDPEFKHKLDETMAEFSKAQESLEASPLSTAEIKGKLAKAKKSFLWFEFMGKSSSGKYVPSLISKSSDSILVEMNDATNLYAAGK